MSGGCSTRSSNRSPPQVGQPLIHIISGLPFSSAGPPGCVPASSIPILRPRRAAVFRRTSRRDCGSRLVVGKRARTTAHGFGARLGALGSGAPPRAAPVMVTGFGLDREAPPGRGEPVHRYRRESAEGEVERLHAG